MLYHCINKWNTIHSKFASGKQCCKWPHGNTLTKEFPDFHIYDRHTMPSAGQAGDTSIKLKYLQPNKSRQKIFLEICYWVSLFCVFVHYCCIYFEILSMQWNIFLHTLLKLSIWPFCVSSKFIGGTVFWELTPRAPQQNEI